VAVPNQGDKKVDLVCEGGGVKGIGLAGAYAVLEEEGWQPQNVAGTSAGAITAALIAAGYTSAELKEIIFGLDFRRFEDKSWEDHIPMLGKPLSIVIENGIYKGDDFLNWIRELLAAKGIRTFADLKTEWVDAKYSSRLQVIASDVTARRLLVLPRDAGVFGLAPWELDVALAVRMSMSIPIFFRPIRLRHSETGQEHVVVDGGMLSNFPVWLFDCEDEEVPDWPTFGLLLVEPEPEKPVAARLPKPEEGPPGMHGLTALLSGMFHTMMEAHDRLYVEKSEFARTIAIPTLGVGTTEFGLPRDRAQALYDSGRSAAEKFLATWDFDAYVAAFRSGKTHSRREEVAAIYRQEASVV
jgi:NTE family protein